MKISAEGSGTGNITYSVSFHGGFEEIQIFLSFWEYPTTIQEVIII